MYGFLVLMGQFLAHSSTILLLCANHDIQQ